VQRAASGWLDSLYRLKERMPTTTALQRLTLASVFLLFAGCATTASRYAVELSSDSREPARSFQEMASSTEIVLEFGQVHKGKLSAESAPAQIESRRMVYDAYLLEIEDSARYKLHVDTDCDCFGFNKTVLSPQILILDAQGAIAAQLDELRPRAQGWTHPAGMDGEIRWQAQPGRHAVLIMGSARQQDPQVATTVSGYVAGGSPVSIDGIPVYSAPFGRYRIEAYRLPD